MRVEFQFEGLFLLGTERFLRALRNFALAAKIRKEGRKRPWLDFFSRALKVLSRDSRTRNALAERLLKVTTFLKTKASSIMGNIKSSFRWHKYH